MAVLAPLLLQHPSNVSITIAAVVSSPDMTEMTSVGQDQVKELPLAKEQSCGCGGCSCEATKEDTYQIITEL